VKLGKIASDTCAMLPEACGGETMKKWHKLFKEGCGNMEDDESCRPRFHRTYEDVEKGRNLVH
jgi:hypothetical protein